MPVFKFSRPHVGGSIAIPGMAVFGENTVIPLYAVGELSIPGIAVIGGASRVICEGDIDVIALGIFGESKVQGNADITFSFGVQGYIPIAFSIRIWNRFGVSGFGVLNGIGSGDVVIQHISLESGKAAMGCVPITHVRVSGFSAISQSALAGNINVLSLSIKGSASSGAVCNSSIPFFFGIESLCGCNGTHGDLSLVAFSCSGTATLTTTSLGTCQVPFKVLSAFGTATKTETGSATVEFPCISALGTAVLSAFGRGVGEVSLFDFSVRGFGQNPEEVSFSTDDAVLRYEVRRRLI